MCLRCVASWRGGRADFTSRFVLYDTPYKIASPTRLPAGSTPSFARPLPDSLEVKFHVFFYLLSQGAFFWTKRRFLVRGEKWSWLVKGDF